MSNFRGDSQHLRANYQRDCGSFGVPGSIFGTNPFGLPVRSFGGGHRRENEGIGEALKYFDVKEEDIWKTVVFSISI